MEEEKPYEKKSAWRWIIGYLIAALIVYGIIYYFINVGRTKNNLSNQQTQNSATTTSSSNKVYLIKTNPSKGPYLTDLKGKTLYIFDKDTKGISACYGVCIAAWPAYTTSSSSNLPDNITVTKRNDKSLQYSYKGKPLYFYILDIRPGDVSGDGLEGIWHLVKP